MKRAPCKAGTPARHVGWSREKHVPVRLVGAEKKSVSGFAVAVIEHREHEAGRVFRVLRGHPSLP